MALPYSTLPEYQDLRPEHFNFDCETLAGQAQHNGSLPSMPFSPLNLSYNSGLLSPRLASGILLANPRLSLRLPSDTFDKDMTLMGVGFGNNHDDEDEHSGQEPVAKRPHHALIRVYCPHCQRQEIVTRGNGCE